MSDVDREFSGEESFFNVDWDAEFTEEITETEIELFKRLAKKIVRMKMTTPSIMFLETIKPMNFFASQAMLFLEPFTAYAFGFKELVILRRAFSKRESIELLIDFVEDYDYQETKDETAKVKSSFFSLKNKIFKKKNDK